ncbi:MAG: hypothetical protein K0R38_3371 [Polyangiaceae bacterium]|jgi:hypothetical protein|nr:hypothetical protein [Polyangiaceae bacterium]
MSPEAIHRVDIIVSFTIIISWAVLLVMLEDVTDPRVRWVRLFSLGPLHRAYDRLPASLGPLHGVLVAAAVLWLAAVLAPARQVRTFLFIASSGCLVLLATASALGG